MEGSRPVTMLPVRPFPHPLGSRFTAFRVLSSSRPGSGVTIEQPERRAAGVQVAAGRAAGAGAAGEGGGSAADPSYAALLLAWCQGSEPAAAALAASTPQLTALVQLVGRWAAAAGLDHLRRLACHPPRCEHSDVPACCSRQAGRHPCRFSRVAGVQKGNRRRPSLLGAGCCSGMRCHQSSQ